MRKTIAAALFAGVAAATAAAQQADPALDDLNRTQPQESPQAGPNELDILSEGENSAFPQIATAKDRKPVSVTLRALNKVTAKFTDITIAMNETTAFGSLEITPRYCDKRPPEEFPETTAFLQITDKSYKPAEAKPDEEDAGAAGVVNASAAQATVQTPPSFVLPEGMIFSGWMFASSPGLNGLQHAVYDVWVIDCKTEVVDN